MTHQKSKPEQVESQSSLVSLEEIDNEIREKKEKWLDLFLSFVMREEVDEKQVTALTKSFRGEFYDSIEQKIDKIKENSPEKDAVIKHFRSLFFTLLNGTGEVMIALCKLRNVQKTANKEPKSAEFSKKLLEKYFHLPTLEDAIPTPLRGESLDLLKRSQATKNQRLIQITEKLMENVNQYFNVCVYFREALEELRSNLSLPLVRSDITCTSIKSEIEGMSDDEFNSIDAPLKSSLQNFLNCAQEVESWENNNHFNEQYHLVIRLLRFFEKCPESKMEQCAEGFCDRIESVLHLGNNSGYVYEKAKTFPLKPVNKNAAKGIMERDSA